MPKQSPKAQPHLRKGLERIAPSPTKVATTPGRKVEGPLPAEANRAVKAKAKAKREQTRVGSASKIGRVIEMMSTKTGASIEQLSKATGWQHHSVRGAISGNVKKKLGLNVTSERVNDVRIYRIGK